MRKTVLIGIIAVCGVGALVFFLSKSGNFSLKSGASSKPAQELYAGAMAFEQGNEFLKAKEAYQQLMIDYPDFKDIAVVQKKLENVAMRIIFSKMETPQTVMHEVQKGDALGKIAKQHNTTVELIKKSNGLAGDTIRLGEKLRIWKGVFGVFVDKSQNILTLKCDDEIIKVYAVATGTNNSTPVGTFTVVNKLANPTWFKSGAIVPAESPENILGTRWLGFDIPGYGIHGTTDPGSIGQQATAGCVRMLNTEVEELYDLLPVGTKVTITD